MALYLSDRMGWVAQSAIRSMTIECNNAGGVNLAQGICDLPVPEVVKKGSEQGIEDGFNIYTRYDGLPQLRQAVSAKYKKTYDTAFDPDKEIICTSGATGAFHCVCLSLLNPGDEVVIFEPFYGYHVKTLIASGAVPVYVKMKPPEWTFTADQLEKMITPRTRGIMINTPGNPSGKVFTKDELLLIAGVAEKHDLFVFTDEIYESFVYDGREHVLPASLPELRHRTITISGCSKVYSITGWRVGYVLCDERWATTIGHFNDLYYVCTPAPLQLGAAAGLNELPASYYTDLCAEYKTKRDKMCDALTGAGLPPVVPQGAYYIITDISSLPGKTSMDKAMGLLTKTGVACVPGKAFYHDDGGENIARFCFARTDDVVDKACERLTA